MGGPLLFDDVRDSDRIVCRSPAPGRTGVTSIPKWKYRAVRRAILDVLEEAGPVGLPFAKLPNAVRARLRPEAIDRLGSVNWHVTTVKLELEVAGEIARKCGVIPQELITT